MPDTTEREALKPLPLSPAEVGDLVLQTREHVQALGWKNREALYPESWVRAAIAQAMAGGQTLSMSMFANRVDYESAIAARSDGPTSEPAVHADGDWRPVRDALEYAYAQLGRQKGPEGYPTPDWNLAVHVHQFAIDRETACANCRKPLRWTAAYRCFDCKAPLCESCAPVHFGPGHADRAERAQGHKPKGHQNA